MSRPRPLWVMPHTPADPQFIRQVLERGEAAPAIQAQVADGSENQSIRKSKAQFLDPGIETDLAQYVMSLVSNANAECYGVDIDSVQALQLTTYRKGDYYGLHEDVQWHTTPEMPVFDRKLSVSILLNDPSEFTGGDLVIEGEALDMAQKGSIAIFPAYVKHEVTKVTKGTRKSLVAWIWGPRWR